MVVYAPVGRHMFDLNCLIFQANEEIEVKAQMLRPTKSLRVA